MKRKRFSSKEFHYIYSRVPRLCVDLVIRTRRGIVLTKRAIAPSKGNWHFPGGTVMKGERLFDAAKRIAKEELGIAVRPGKILGAIEFFFRGYFGQPVSIVIEAKARPGQKIRLDWQASAVGAFTRVPKKTIPAQRKFLIKTLGMRSM